MYSISRLKFLITLNKREVLILGNMIMRFVCFMLYFLKQKSQYKSKYCKIRTNRKLIISFAMYLDA